MFDYLLGTHMNVWYVWKEDVECEYVEEDENVLETWPKTKTWLFWNQKISSWMYTVVLNVSICISN